MLADIQDLAKKIISPRHALYEDITQEGCLGYLEAQEKGKSHTKSLIASEDVMREYLVKEREHTRDKINYNPDNKKHQEPIPVPSLSYQSLELVETMPEPERSVLLHRFNDPPFPRRVIAKNLNLSVEQVRRIEKNALTILRKALPSPTSP